jgi:hypothetical protein
MSTVGGRTSSIILKKKHATVSWMDPATPPEGSRTPTKFNHHPTMRAPMPSNAYIKQKKEGTTTQIIGYAT